MEIPIRTQLVQAATGLLFGGAFGLFWDVLRLFRRRMSRLPGNALGLAGLLAISFFAFLAGRRIGAGMRLFFLSACALGWAAYLWGMSEAVGGVWGCLKHFASKCIKKQQKIQ